MLFDGELSNECLSAQCSSGSISKFLVREGFLFIGLVSPDGFLSFLGHGAALNGGEIVIPYIDGFFNLSALHVYL
jgi:hypothetical protein